MYSYSYFIKNHEPDVHEKIRTAERTTLSIKHNIRPKITT